MPFAVSIALPPPTATTKSQALDLKASIPFCTELTSGQGSNEVNQVPCDSHTCHIRRSKQKIPFVP